MLGDNLRDIMSERNLSIQELADQAGIPFETLRNIYYNKVRDPKVSTVYQLSKVLGVTVNFLFGDEKLKEDEDELLRLYKNSGERGKSLIRLVARYEYGIASREKKTNFRYRVPCIVPYEKSYDSIPGSGNGIVEVYTDNKRAFLAMELTTNNFAPMFCKGDRILLENRFPENEERAVFELEGRVYFRQLIELEDCICLRSFNRVGKDIIIKRADEVECLGTYIGILGI